MATTKVDWIKRECIEKVKRKGIVKAMKTDFEMAQRDADKAGDPDDHAYHTGRMDALSDILYTLGWRLKTDKEYDAERT